MDVDEYPAHLAYSTLLSLGPYLASASASSLMTGLAFEPPALASDAPTAMSATMTDPFEYEYAPLPYTVDEREGLAKSLEEAKSAWRSMRDELGELRKQAKTDYFKMLEPFFDGTYSESQSNLTQKYDRHMTKEAVRVALGCEGSRVTPSRYVWGLLDRHLVDDPSVVTGDPVQLTWDLGNVFEAAVPSFLHLERMIDQVEPPSQWTLGIAGRPGDEPWPTRTEQELPEHARDAADCVVILCGSWRKKRLETLLAKLEGNSTPAQPCTATKAEDSDSFTLIDQPTDSSIRAANFNASPISSTCEPASSEKPPATWASFNTSIRKAGQALDELSTKCCGAVAPFHGSPVPTMRSDYRRFAPQYRELPPGVTRLSDDTPTGCDAVTTWEATMICPADQTGAKNLSASGKLEAATERPIGDLSERSRWMGWTT